jgi:hypothetical protein
MKRFTITLLAFALPVLPQCSQCFRTASAQTDAARQALNSAVLILLIPALCILAGFCYLAWRRRNV